MATIVSSKRAQAVERAEANAPFLRSAIAAFPAISDSFVEEGSEAAVDLALALRGESVGEQLRRQRHALALAVALADISGEQPLEWVTAKLSGFADQAMDDAIRAAMLERVPFANGAPNLTCDFPAMEQLAKSKGVPIGGKDFKTGQTMIKTVLSPMFKARMLGVAGWYSTNILGNRDGEVLDDPESFKTKEESKLGVLEYILQPQIYPELYGNMYHKVRINYYPPRGDNKEGWDNIDIFGWLGYPMQIKVDFLCRDSILAAPLVLDLALFFDLSQRAGLTGIQEWLSFYFKSPQVAPGLYPEHDLFIQQLKLKNTLRYLMGEKQITHLGIEYYLED